VTPEESAAIDDLRTFASIRGSFLRSLTVPEYYCRKILMFSKSKVTEYRLKKSWPTILPGEVGIECDLRISGILCIGKTI
jgi:hypothetical protein